MYSSSLTPSKKPIDQCKDMLNEVNTMLKLVKFGSAPKKISFCKKPLPSEFTNAMSILKARVTQGVDSPGSYESSRLKLNSPSSLGPGHYFKQKLNESQKLPRHLTLKDFESRVKSNSKQKSSINLRSSHPRSPREHNMKVKERLEKRIEIFHINNIRKRDRFKTQINTQMADSKKQYFNELMRMFYPLAVLYGLNLIVKQKIIFTKIIKKKSKFLLGFLFWVSKFLGSSRKMLKKIRRNIATKNIECITKPFLRFVTNKRQSYKTKVLKHVKLILRSNLLVLLLYRFLRYVCFIQASFRRYRIIKTTRLQVLMKKINQKGFTLVHFWNSSSVNQKFDVLIRFYREEAYKYSKAKSKYMDDTSAVNKKFSRNFSFWNNDSFNQAAGRNFNFVLPDPPQFDILSKIDQLSQYINSFDYRSRKKRLLRSTHNEKSYY